MTEFAGAGRRSGLELWRIENMIPVKMKCTGRFHTGDAYIVLKTTSSVAGALSWNIHFWLGSECSADEAGVAAYKTVELDDSLGGGPVQYREVQGLESPLFLSYFKKSGIEYLPGGVTTGFRKVEKGVYEKRLLHLKGKRTVRVKEVPLSVDSLNKGDVFVLDCGLTLYLFNGPESNLFEKVKGVEVVQHINSDERGGKADVVLVHEDPQNADFWELLGGYVDPETLPPGEPDTDVSIQTQRKLYQLSDASGKMEFIEITPSSGKLEKSILDTNDVFLLQSYNGKIFCWVGRESGVELRKEVTQRAIQYVELTGLPKSTPIERVAEGYESASFKSEFLSWDPPKNFGMSGKSTSSLVQESVNDVAAILSRKAVEDTPVDDGSGKLQIWVIKDFQKCEIPKEEYGQFFGGDSYILLYSYNKGRADEYIIYYWLGKDSSIDEQGAAALLAVELDDEMGGKPVQVRVTQGKEPAHFRQLFMGWMIVFSGGHASGFDQNGATVLQLDDLPEIGLFHVRGTTALNTSAVQVKADSSSLNSEDCFVLVTTTHSYTWMGCNSNTDEFTIATNTAATLATCYKGKGGREVVELAEGEEPEEFWLGLGGKTDYPTAPPGEHQPQPPRLFSASTSTGVFKIEEVDNFDQSDLNDEDVFLLDTYTQLFVWVGTQASSDERRQSILFAHRYVAEADDGRDPDIPIIQVTGGQEPSMFCCHFHPWDPDYTNKRTYLDPYQVKLEALSAEKARREQERLIEETEGPASKPNPSNPMARRASFTAVGPFKAEELRENKIPGVDPACKEQYLSDEDFLDLFGMNKTQFMTLPKWKIASLKKKVDLF